MEEAVYQHLAVSLFSGNMSRRQCCVWGCHNRKGRYPEDIDENRLCECINVQTKHCPKRDILSLHTIELMPHHVKQAVLQKINLTRQGPGGNKWRPTKDSVICNVHYENFKGPTRDSMDVVPIYFKRPRHYPSTISVPKRKKVTERRKQKPVQVVAQLSRHVNVAIPQAGALHNELNVDRGEWQQSSSVESSTELVDPGNMSRYLVDTQLDHVQLTVSPDDMNEGDLSGEQSKMEENVPLDTDVTNEYRTEHSRQLVSNFTPQPESNELHHFNDQLYMCRESDQLRHDNDRLQQENDQLLQENAKLREEIMELRQTIKDYNSNAQ